MTKIYTTPSCAYCKMAKGFFKSRDLPYDEVDVSKDANALEEMMAGAGRMSVPVIRIEETFVVGFDRPRIEQLLGLSIEK